MVDEYFQALRNVVQEVKDANDDVGRIDKVVQDEAGLFHISVMSLRDAAQPFVVAMCDVFDEIDSVVVAEDLGKFGMPKRRWPADQETEGMVTCLRCIGL